MWMPPVSCALIFPFPLPFFFLIRGCCRDVRASCSSALLFLSSFSFFSSFRSALGTHRDTRRRSGHSSIHSRPPPLFFSPLPLFFPRLSGSGEVKMYQARNQQIESPSPFPSPFFFLDLDVAKSRVSQDAPSEEAPWSLSLPFSLPFSFSRGRVSSNQASMLIVGLSFVSQPVSSPSFLPVLLRRA